ncbi:hypothetical protein [Kaistella rhinocerotis]|uniref:hypothetical protein n=1 Tax=Kaistella rhinocerotis TaxID=3026437 RepID=UPI0025557D13|nr:hypothetical protein [Kaistella sp. Ran72]
MLPNITEFCHWLRRTFGFRTQTEGLRTKFRRGVKNLSEAVRRSQSLIESFTFSVNHPRDPSFVGMTAAVQSTHSVTVDLRFHNGALSPRIFDSGRDFVIGCAEPSVSEHRLKVCERSSGAQ